MILCDIVKTSAKRATNYMTNLRQEIDEGEVHFKCIAGDLG